MPLHHRPLSYILSRYTRPLSRFVSPSRKIIAFGSVLSPSTYGNPYPIFQSFRRCKDFTSYWVTPFRRHLVRENIWFYSLRGLWILSHAGTLVLDSRRPLPVVSENRRVVQTWHGVGLKTMRMHNRFVPEPERRYALQRYVETLSLFLVTSAFMKQHFTYYLGVPEEKIAVTGYPRNDIFFQPEAIQLARRYATDHSPLPFQHLILYAPTWRYQQRDWWPFAATDYARLQDLLEKTKSLLVIRLHYYDARRRNFATPLNSGRVVQYETFFGRYDIQQALAATDILITDYSSIAYDFLLLQRPIIIVAPDADAFAGEQGLIEGYHQLLPGPLCERPDDFLRILEAALAGDDPSWKQRTRVLPHFHTYVDGHSTERAVEAILQL